MWFAKLVSFSICISSGYPLSFNGCSLGSSVFFFWVFSFLFLVLVSRIQCPCSLGFRKKLLFTAQFQSFMYHTFVSKYHPRKFKFMILYPYLAIWCGWLQTSYCYLLTIILEKYFYLPDSLCEIPAAPDGAGGHCLQELWGLRSGQDQVQRRTRHHQVRRTSGIPVLDPVPDLDPDPA